MTFDESANLGFTASHEYGSPWSLGQKIVDSMFGKHVDMFYTRTEQVYLYCPPCGRLLHTALSLCKELKAINKFWSLRVRPDDRLAASCCREEIKSKRLESIVEMSKEIEAKTVFRSSKDETLKESHVTLLDR
jgi:hypothetical protein